MPLIRPLVLIALLLLAPALSAQVFYEVRQDDGPVNWLLGTVHSEDPRLLEFPPVLSRALADAEVLALELVPDSDTLARLNEAMTLPNGEALDEYLEPELYQRVVDLLADYGMGEPAARRLRPWAAAMTLSAPPPQTGLFMDLGLAVRAAGHGTRVTGLETLDEQLDFLVGLGVDAHVRMLESAIEDLDGGRELFEQLLSAYLEGDLDVLVRLATRELDAMGPGIGEQFHEQGIIVRNRNMAERAAPLLEEGGALVAVGALHLPGEDGLLALLRRAGWTVEPVY